MFSETGLTIYFWGTYAWFCIGFLLVGVPAIIEIIRMSKGGTFKEIKEVKGEE